MLVTALVGVITVLLSSALLWSRGWSKLSNLMYYGYPDAINGGELPPLWRLRISGVALALSRFKFRKVPEAYSQAEQMANGEETFLTYAKSVFVDE
jgi:hypothetical protein